MEYHFLHVTASTQCALLLWDRLEDISSLNTADGEYQHFLDTRIDPEKWWLAGPSNRGSSASKATCHVTGEKSGRDFKFAFLVSEINFMVCMDHSIDIHNESKIAYPHLY